MRFPAGSKPHDFGSLSNLGRSTGLRDQTAWIGLHYATRQDLSEETWPIPFETQRLQHPGIAETRLMCFLFSLMPREDLMAQPGGLFAR